MFGWFKRNKKGDAAGPAAPKAPMVTVRFEDDSLEVEVEQGSMLADVCDDKGFSLGFGCREGGCGTCMIEIIDGMENLSPRNSSEDEMLEIMAEGNANARLACQCEVKGNIQFRALDL